MATSSGGAIPLTAAGIDALRREASAASVVDLIEKLSDTEVETLVAATAVLDRLRAIDEHQRETGSSGSRRGPASLAG